MTYQPTAISNDLGNLPQLPGWVTFGRAETPETVAFRSGAALTVLDQLVSDPGHGVPLKLLANRLALSAATGTSKLEGRMAREADMRDAYHLAPPGEARGPDGDLLAFWRGAVRLRLGGSGEIANLVGPDLAEGVAGWLDTGQECARTRGPLTGCVSILRAVLDADDRAERVACLLSDIVLARARMDGADRGGAVRKCVAGQPRGSGAGGGAGGPGRGADRGYSGRVGRPPL